MPKTLRNLLSLLLVLSLVATACGGDDDADDATAAPEPAAESSVHVTAVDFDAGIATITNTGDSDADLSGHWLCNRPAYVEVPGQTLAPGDSVDVALGGLAADGGEVGLYTSDNFGSSDDIVDYVTWGSGGGRLSVAEGAGVWSGAPIAETGVTLSLSGDAGSAAGWGG